MSSDECFAQTVPRLAVKAPVLYRACLALAARTMYLWGLETSERADKFLDDAISQLIPLLSPGAPSTATDAVLATTVLLRMLEQFTEPTEDTKCHMNGASSLFSACELKWTPDRLDIQGVSFWTFVRENLRICFLFEQDCCFDLSIVDKRDALSAAKDPVWTNRITYLLAEICHVCWSQTTSQEPLHHYLDRLEEDINAWRRSLPPSFQPWYYHQSSSEPFPTVMYFSRWHGMFDSLSALTELIATSHWLATVLHCQNNACSVQAEEPSLEHSS